MAGRSASSSVTRYAGLQVQTSALGLNIPIGWGTFRCKCNLVDYLDFKSTANKAASGKGGSTTTSYTYAASLIMAICEGPIDALPTVYVNGKIYADGAKTALAQTSLSLSNGTVGQAVWPYLTSSHPVHAIGYSGLAIVYATNYGLGASASPPNHSFEVVRTSAFGVPGTPDADPSLVVADFFENSRTGVPGWRAGLLGDLTQYQDYCLAAGLLVSPVIDNQRSAKDFLDELLKATNSTCVWSEGGLKFIPYGDAPLAGSGKTFTPDITPVYALGDDDFVVEKDEAPILVDIMDQSDAYNVVQLEYLDRSNQYNMAIALASDAANVAQYGVRRKDPDTVHCIASPAAAAISAQLYLQRTLYIRAQYKFKLGWMFAALEPGDIVELTDPGLGLAAYPVRITQIDEDQHYGLAITAEDAPIGVGASPLYAMQESLGQALDHNVESGDASAPVVFNAPLSLTGGGLEVWIGAAGGPHWGGAQVWTSLDGTNYQYSGLIEGAARYGVTTSTLPVGADPDTVHTLGVDLSASGGELTSATQMEADASASLCLVDAELIAFETATLTGANQYALDGYVRRGQFGTTIAAHAAGAPFVRIDGALFEYPYLATQANQTVYVKLVSFNVYGGGLQDISTVPAYEIVPAGVPAPGAGDWSGAGSSVGGETGAAPILTLTGAVDRPGVQTVIVEYRQLLGPTPTYGAWARADYPAASTTIAVNVGAAGTYAVRVRYRALGGAENAAAYLDLGLIAVGVPLQASLADVTNLATVYQAGITRLVWSAVEDYRGPDYEVRLGPTWASASPLGRTTGTTFTTHGDGTYWVAAHYVIPNAGGDVYSSTPAQVVIAGSQLTSNIVAAYDEAATGWSGTLTDASVVSGTVVLTLGDPAGAYQVPTGHRINIGRVAACNVVISLAGHAVSTTDDVLSTADLLGVADLLDGALGPFIGLTPQIRLSQDGTTWGAWANWSAGAYAAMVFDFRVVLASSEASVSAVLTGFTVAVDAPDRTDSFPAQSVASGGSTITFTAPFNGGPGGSATPNVQATILNASPGDDLIVTVTASAITAQVKNGGAGVARTVSFIAQGY